MEYIYTITTTDADGNQTTTEYTINATDARTAHNAAETNKPHGATVRVYPSTATAAGIMRGAVMVGRRTAINAIKRQGTPTQHRIEREFAAINARLVGAETPERINAVIADYSADTQDFYSLALMGLQEGRTAGASIGEQYHAAFLTLNKYIHAQRAATEYEISTEFLTDGGGDLVAINTAISAIIRGGEKWTPTDGGEMDAATAARLGAAIADAMRIVTPTQRKIAELLGRGYSQRQIAEQTGRKVASVNQNIAIMRNKIAEYIRDNSPEFVQLIRTAETAAAAQDVATHNADADKRRTDAGAARHNANANRKRTEEGKRRERERKAAYKARKAAERAAAITAEYERNNPPYTKEMQDAERAYMQRKTEESAKRAGLTAVYITDENGNTKRVWTAKTIDE